MYDRREVLKINERRSSRFTRHSEGRVYYPSDFARSERRSRFRPRGEEDKAGSTDKKRSLLTRFRPRQSTESGSKKAEKRFRPHSTPTRTAAASAPAGDIAAREASAAPRAELPPAPPQYYQPAYPYYPAPPVYPVYPPPPPPPASSYAVYDPYGRRLSEEDIRRLDALEALEDRYGRDFDRYSGSSASSSGSKEIFPKNYLVDADEQ